MKCIVRNSETGEVIKLPHGNTKVKCPITGREHRFSDFGKAGAKAAENLLRMFGKEPGYTDKVNKYMKKLYKFYWDCGRQGDLTGVFIATDDEIKNALGKQAWFGEILGKHSEIYGDLDEKDLTILTDDQDFFEKFEKLVGKSTGYNPLNYIDND